MSARKLHLDRERGNAQGTPGFIALSPAFGLFTLELPWRNNQHDISRIPAGTYPVHWVSTPKHPHGVYMLQDVPNRGAIELHAGNVAGDRSLGYHTHSLGCFLLGMRRGQLLGQRAVLDSHRALRIFEQHLQREAFILHIHDPEGFHVRPTQ